MSPSENPSGFMLIVFYVGSIFTQLFLPCYYGNEIQLNNSLILQEMFASDWPKESRGFKKNLIVFCENLNKPIKMKVGKRFQLNLSTFTTVSIVAFQKILILTFTIFQN